MAVRTAPGLPLTGREHGVARLVATSPFTPAGRSPSPQCPCPSGLSSATSGPRTRGTGTGTRIRLTLWLASRGELSL